MTGCCHAGIANTVETFARLVPEIKVKAIVGGLHLCHVADEEIAWTADYLSRLALSRLVLLHCTGDYAGAALKSELSCLVIWGSAGKDLGLFA